MNKRELISAVAKETHMTQNAVAPVVDAVFNTITTSLAAGEKVNVTNFGTFEAKHREARVGFNPRTKEAFDVPAKNVPVFKPSTSLKEKM